MIIAEILFTATLFAAAGQPTGEWDSMSCGARTYRRTIMIHDDGTFRADDMPHPCPGECVVQHVFKREGTWKMTGAVVRFTVKNTDDTSGSEEKAAAPLPGEMHFNAKKHVLTEPGVKGPCLYKGG